MKDFLQDLVAHTHTLGVLPLVRITASEERTYVDSIAEDRSVILNATTHVPVTQLDGIFGMPNLNKLDLHLKCPEYKENAVISLIKETRDGTVVPTGLHFENEAGDFQNDYRFMVQKVVDIKMQSATFLGATWNVEFNPSAANIQRLKFQAAAHTEETVFQVSTKNDDLIFSFGDHSTHAGSFVFQNGISGLLKSTWAWPIAQIVSVLSLNGDKTVKIADAGALQITVDSGLAVYNYIFPAQTK